jgi:hypothetical protein
MLFRFLIPIRSSEVGIDRVGNVGNVAIKFSGGRNRSDEAILILGVRKGETFNR